MKALFCFAIVVGLLVFALNSGGASGVASATFSLFKIFIMIGVSLLVFYVIGKSFTK